MVFFTASPFLVRSLSVRALVIFFGFVSVLCGAGLLMSRTYPSQPVPLAKASVLNTTGSTELPALSQRGQ